MLSESQIEKHFAQYGKISRVGVERSSHTALVQFDSVDDAKEAMEAAKGKFIGNSHSKIMVRHVMILLCSHSIADCVLSILI